MENHIYILDDIGTGAVTKAFVESQYNPKAEKVIVHINSNGGEVDEGLAIRDFLMEIPQPVHTIGEGMVASIATMPFLAGNTRELKPNCQFLAHLPSLGNFDGNSDDFERAANYMVDIRRRIASIYSEYTGQSVNDMEDFMRLDQPVFANKAKDMGFATYVPEFKAVAKLNLNNIKMAENKELELSKLDKIANKIDAFFNSVVNETSEEKEPKNENVELSDGSMLFVESEDGEFEGKRVFLTDEEGNRTDQVAPEGNYALTDGRSLSVDAEGIIISISESSEGEEEMSDKDKEIEALKAELAAKNEEAATLTNEMAELKATNDARDQEVKNSIEELKLEINNVKSMTVGGEPVIAKANIKPSNKSEANVISSGLGSWGKSIINK